jgi:hypothetical protein
VSVEGFVRRDREQKNRRKKEKEKKVKNCFNKITKIERWL